MWLYAEAKAVAVAWVCLILLRRGSPRCGRSATPPSPRLHRRGRRPRRAVAILAHRPLLGRRLDDKFGSAWFSQYPGLLRPERKTVYCYINIINCVLLVSEFWTTRCANF